jgi:hypothetical protein
MSLTERIKVEHLVRRLRRAGNGPREPARTVPGTRELAVVEYVRADTYREAVEALRQISALLDVVSTLTTAGITARA